jgi:hypothetical protein
MTLFEKLRAIPLVALAATWPDAAEAKIDAGGTGVSDLWHQLYPGADLDGDADGDGFTGREEAIAGTNPFDQESRPSLKVVAFDQENRRVSLTWDAVVGKRYTLERPFWPRRSAGSN